MKILIVSDSHGNTADFLFAVQKENPDCLFFLGDVEKDFYYIRDMCPGLSFFAVSGNNDFFSSLNTHDTVSISGKKIFYCHGHTQSVRSGTGMIKNTLHSVCGDIALFGHTHESLLEYDGDRIILNPGAMYDGRYAVLEIKGSTVSAELKRI